jgi:AcrR family transcriptional regulator
LSASDAPQRDPGLRTRSGNAMLRTRRAILEAAEQCVQEQGVRGTTMGQIASTGGVAKATLYNHFRTKDDVLRALVEARVAALAEQCTGRPAAEALEHAARVLAGSAALRRVAEQESALLVPLLVVGDGRAWQSAREAVGQLVPPGSVELVLRWLVSQLLWPLPADAARAQAQTLARAGASPVPAQGTPAERAHPAGLGWPDTLRTR